MHFLSIFIFDEFDSLFDPLKSDFNKPIESSTIDNFNELVEISFNIIKSKTEDPLYRKPVIPQNIKDILKNPSNENYNNLLNYSLQ